MKDTLHLMVATRNSLKVAAIERIFNQLLPDSKITVDVHDVASGVPDTPWEEETKIGAQNRAQALCKLADSKDYYVGVESGLVTRYGDIYEEAWACIITPENGEYYGFSSGLKLPHSIIQLIETDGITHAEAMTIMQKKFDLAPGDTWGNYTASKVSRSNSIEEAVRNALIQIVSPPESLYKVS